MFRKRLGCDFERIGDAVAMRLAGVELRSRMPPYPRK
jgi:hypothetical protein